MKSTKRQNKTARDWVVVLGGQHGAGTATYVGELDHGVRQGVRRIENATRFTRLGARRVLAGYPSAVATGQAYAVQIGRNAQPTSHGHARKTKAQLDREIAEILAASEPDPAVPRSAAERDLRDASRLNALWKKHVSFETRNIDVDRLHDVVRREIKIVKKGLATGTPQATRGLLTELRNDLREIGSIKKRRRR